MGLQAHWSTTTGNNQTADAQVNLRELQSPSSVNDAIRLVDQRAAMGA